MHYIVTSYGAFYDGFLHKSLHIANGGK